MNCCDDYGNCTQGRDCPIRAASMIPIKEQGRSPIRGSAWRRQIGGLLKWIALGLLAWLVYIPLFYYLLYR
jgi:hypothetical protein